MKSIVIVDFSISPFNYDHHLKIYLVVVLIASWYIFVIINISLYVPVYANIVFQKRGLMHINLHFTGGQTHNEN